MDRATGIYGAFVACIALLFYQPVVQAQDESPGIDAIEPATVNALTGFTLILKGGGFTNTSRVYIQSVKGTGGKPDRYNKYTPEFINESELSVELSFGFGLRPRTRKIYVKNDDGNRSNFAVITVVPVGVEIAEEPEPENEITTDSSDENENNGSEQDAPPADDISISNSMTEDPEEVPESVVIIERIEPDRVAAGERLSMFIFGKGFVKGCELQILANANAGTFLEPEYKLISLSVDYLDEEVLEVFFDKGFYAEPSKRVLYIVNPDGGRSNEMELEIYSTRESENEQ